MVCRPACQRVRQHQFTQHPYGSVNSCGSCHCMMCGGCAWVKRDGGGWVFALQSIQQLRSACIVPYWQAPFSVRRSIINQALGRCTWCQPSHQLFPHGSLCRGGLPSLFRPCACLLYQPSCASRAFSMVAPMELRQSDIWLRFWRVFLSCQGVAI